MTETARSLTMVGRGVVLVAVGRDDEDERGMAGRGGRDVKYLGNGRSQAVCRSRLRQAHSTGGLTMRCDAMRGRRRGRGRARRGTCPLGWDVFLRYGMYLFAPNGCSGPLQQQTTTNGRRLSGTTPPNACRKSPVGWLGRNSGQSGYNAKRRERQIRCATGARVAGAGKAGQKQDGGNRTSGEAEEYIDCYSLLPLPAWTVSAVLRRVCTCLGM